MLSDRELVTLDATQFAQLQTVLTAHNNALWAINDQLKQGKKLDAIIDMLRNLAGVPAELGLIKEELSVVHQLVADSNSEAINNLTRKVEEFMSTQEERLRGVKTKLDNIQSGVDKIQQQLADLKTNNPELEDEIAAIEATANAIDTDVNPVVAPEEPAPTEPTP